jgi:hypothetical protein
MARHFSGLSLILVASILLLSVALPASAVSPSFPTTAVAASGLKQTVIGGNSVIEVNYTSSLATSFTAFVYLDLMNSMGQTVYVNLGTCSLSQFQLQSCFVALSSSISTGAYTAKLFASNTDNVPVSGTSSLAVAV